jgi:hypothetical protein
MRYSFNKDDNTVVNRLVAEGIQKDKIAQYNMIVKRAIQTGELTVKPNQQYLLYGDADPTKQPNFNLDTWLKASEMVLGNTQRKSEIVETAKGKIIPTLADQQRKDAAATAATKERQRVIDESKVQSRAATSFRAEE